MHKLVVAVCLAFASTALACSPKGYAANGAVKLPAGMALTCQGKLVDDARDVVKSAQWVEVVTGPYTTKSAQLMGELLNRLEQAGYARQSVKKGKGDIVFKYTKQDREIDALIVPSTARAYMVMIGK